MTRLYFIRHGESEANRLRVISNRGRQHGLTARGQAEARALAQRLSGAGLAAVYASPLLRAAETAAIIAARAQAAVHESAALKEFDCGEWEGRGDAAAWAAHAALMAAWEERGEREARALGGESLAEVRDRFVPFVRGLTVAYCNPDDAVALVSHGGLLRLMLPLVLANVDGAFARAVPIGHCTPIVAEAQGGVLMCLDWCGTVPRRLGVMAAG
jgi:probable phosphoglycerate mutase